MERADHDRSVRADRVAADPAPSGVLDVPPQGKGTDGGSPAGPRASRAPVATPEAPGSPGRPPGFPRRFLTAITSRPWLRRFAGYRATQQVALLLCYVAAGIAVTWPRATFLGAEVPGSRDSASYVWGFWWVARQVTHLGNPWLTHHMAAPVGVQLGFHTLMPLPGLVMTPITLTGGPVLAYNLLVTVTPGLLSYTAYRAARLWLRSATGAIAAGVFYGLSAMLTQQDWYHLNIALGVMFLPMALEASVRLRRRPGRRQAVILGVVMGAAVLTDQESAVLAAIVTALTLLPWLLIRPSWAKTVPAAVAVVIGSVIASPQIIAMVQEIVAAHGGLAINSHLLAVSDKKYGIGLPGMFSPSPRVAEFGMSLLAAPFLHGRDNEGMPMFGTVLTVLAVLGVVAARRRRSSWQLAGLWLGCATLALGPSLWIGLHQYVPVASVWHGVRVSDIMPYTWFVRIPGLSSFREADRLALLGLLPAALLAGAAVEWLRYHARPAIVLVGALAVLESGYSGTPAVSTLHVASYSRLDTQIAADHSNSIVVDLPYGLRGGIPVYGLPFFPQALLMATQDGHPRAISYTSRVPRPTTDAINADPFYRYLISIQHQIKVSPADLAAARANARRMHIGWAIVWRRNPSVQNWVLPYLRGTGFTYDYRVGNTLVYRLR